MFGSFLPNLWSSCNQSVRSREPTLLCNQVPAKTNFGTYLVSQSLLRTSPEVLARQDSGLHVSVRRDCSDVCRRPFEYLQGENVRDKGPVVSDDAAGMFRLVHILHRSYHHQFFPPLDTRHTQIVRRRTPIAIGLGYRRHPPEFCRLTFHWSEPTRNGEWIPHQWA